MERISAHLEPLRAGITLVSAEDLAKVEADWVKWRAEWVRRKKIFTTYVRIQFHSALDNLFSANCFLEFARPKSSFVVLIYSQCRFWQLATDTLTPQDATSLIEDLGIELDTPEHCDIERSLLNEAQKSPNALKRKRNP